MSRQVVLQPRRTYLLDGSMGSCLESRYGASPHGLWSSGFSVTAPELVQFLHEEYIEAGADIITTNTFRTNPLALQRAGLNSDESIPVKSAVHAALCAARGKDVLVAGSNAPAEDCYSPVRTLQLAELQYNHEKHINELMDAGADFILCETQSHRDEILMLCALCGTKRIPFIMSLFFTPGGLLLSGEPLQEIIMEIQNYSPVAVGFNCISAAVLDDIFSKITLPVNWGFYLNCGAGIPTDRKMSCGVTPELYCELARPYLRAHPAFIGTCCGSSPGHTKRLHTLLNETNNNLFPGQD